MEQRQRPTKIISIDGFVSSTRPNRLPGAPAVSPKIRRASISPNAAIRRTLTPQTRQVVRPRPVASEQMRATPRIGNALLSRPQAAPASPTPVAVRPRAATPDELPTPIMPEAPESRPVAPPLKRSKADRPKRKRRPMGSRKKIALKAAGVLSALVLVVGGWLGYKFLNNTNKIFGGNIASNLTSLFKPVPLKGQETGRVNILLAGNSADDAGHDGALLTDSVMVVSVDVENNKAFMLSIPRDLWVDIPGVGHKKINEAYYWGDMAKFSENGYPKGGMGLLAKVVEQNFGIHSHYYSLVNYSAFRDAVNAVGGISVNVSSTDPRGIYDPNIDWTTKGPLVKLSNGTHTLNGQQALNLARARGSAYGAYGFAQSDFTRTEYQRKMLLGLKDKASNAKTLSNPLRVSGLFDAIGNNVKTDFKLNELLTLQSLMKKIDSGKISSLALVDNNRNLLTSYATPTGQSALIPAAGIDDFSEITAFLQKIMSNNPMVQEAPTVAVLNGTETTGLAAKQKATLAGKGFVVTTVGDAAKKPYAKTTIVDNTKGKKPASKKTLSQLFPGATFTTSTTETAGGTADFVVILGNN